MRFIYSSDTIPKALHGDVLEHTEGTCGTSDFCAGHYKVLVDGDTEPLTFCSHLIEVFETSNVDRKHIMSTTIKRGEFTYHLTCNNKPRPLHTYFDLPDNERADFDYIEAEDRYSARLFKYRGSWYDYFEFEAASELFKAEGFDGVQTQSAFDAVLVRYFDREGYEYDGEIVVAHVHW